MNDTTVKITAAPHVRSPESTTRIMWSVVLSLVPVIAASIFFFGPSAVLVLGASTAGCLLTERLFGARRNSISDGSAVITGLLLGMCLPAGIPLWMAFLGGVFGVAFGKLIFGGLGQNVFNPALLGRAFLQAAFPVAITTWPVRGENWWALAGDNLAFPFMAPTVMDAMTGATPLGILKFSDDPVVTPVLNLILGSTGGSLGETSAGLILAGGIYLAIRGHLNWHIPVSILLTVFVFTGILWLANPERFADPLFHLLTGGLLLGAIYMATDYVTSPMTTRGMVIYGVGIGVVTVLIRVFGAYPEGVQFAILIFNGFTPLLNKYIKPRRFGKEVRNG